MKTLLEIPQYNIPPLFNNFTLLYPACNIISKIKHMAYSEGLHNIGFQHLMLDPHNPRLALEMQHQSDEEVISWMLNNASLTELMASIVENGFFGGEPLVGTVSNDGSGKVIIVEGNRRLAAVKLLNTPDIARYLVNTVTNLSVEAIEKGTLPKELPVYIVANREAVATYLGFRHISGVRPWPVIAKARYLYSLYQPMANLPDVYRKLAKEIGSKPVYVRRLIVGYQLFEHIANKGFYDEPNLSEETFDLSLINDAATRYTNIMAYMGVDADSQQPLVNLQEVHFKNVFKWLYERKDGVTRLGEGRNLPLLNRIVGDKTALTAFEEDDKLTIYDAASLTELADDTMRAYLQQARTSLREAQKYMHTIRAAKNSDRDLADEVASIALNISRSIFEHLSTSKSRA